MGGDAKSKGRAAQASRGWRIGVALSLLAVIGFLAANTVIVDGQTRPAEARSGGTIIDTGVEPANVKVEGDGPPLVLIHGFGAALDWWDEIAPDLARGHRVIRLDLIGHGGTAAPTLGYSLERQAALVTAVLDKLGVSEPVTIIGHSMGGEVATAFAEANPSRVARMVLIDSPPKAETTFNLGTRLALMPVIGELLSHFETDASIRKSLAQAFAPGRDVPEKFVADFKQLTYSAFRTAHEESIAFETAKPVWERLKALANPPPLLVLFGAEDQIISPASARLYEAVPGAKVEIIKGSGHSPMVEEPEKVLEAIRSFLAQP